MEIMSRLNRLFVRGVIASELLVQLRVCHIHLKIAMRFQRLVRCVSVERHHRDDIAGASRSDCGFKRFDGCTDIHAPLEIAGDMPLPP